MPRLVAVLLVRLVLPVIRPVLVVRVTEVAKVPSLRVPAGPPRAPALAVREALAPAASAPRAVVAVRPIGVAREALLGLAPPLRGGPVLGVRGEARRPLPLPLLARVAEATRVAGAPGLALLGAAAERAGPLVAEGIRVGTGAAGASATPGGADGEAVAADEAAAGDEVVGEEGGVLRNFSPATART